MGFFPEEGLPDRAVASLEVVSTSAGGEPRKSCRQCKRVRCTCGVLSEHGDTSQDVAAGPPAAKRARPIPRAATGQFAASIVRGMEAGPPTMKRARNDHPSQMSSEALQHELRQRGLGTEGTCGVLSARLEASRQYGECVSENANLLAFYPTGAQALLGATAGPSTGGASGLELFLEDRWGEDDEVEEEEREEEGGGGPTSHERRDAEEDPQAVDARDGGEVGRVEAEEGHDLLLLALEEGRDVDGQTTDGQTVEGRDAAHDLLLQAPMDHADDGQMMSEHQVPAQDLAVDGQMMSAREAHGRGDGAVDGQMMPDGQTMQGAGGQPRAVQGGRPGIGRVLSEFTGSLD